MHFAFYCAHDNKRELTPAFERFYFVFGQVIFDFENLSDLIGRVAFDQNGDHVASQIQQAFDGQIVGRLNQGKEFSRSV